MTATWLRGMRNSILVLLFSGMLLSACGSDLWGSYDPFLTETPAELTRAAASPTFGPTSTFTPVPPTLTAIPTDTETSTPTETATPSGPTSTPKPLVLYNSQSGDSLSVVATHFGVQTSEISSSVNLPSSGFLNPSTALIIPNRLDKTTPSNRIMPDSEVVYSPTAIDFDILSYVSLAGGKLSKYEEYLKNSSLIFGGQDVKRIALESSINPRLLLALIQYRSGWVQGQPTAQDENYPLGFYDAQYKGLYQQMRWVIQQLAAGYYGWRSGKLVQLTFPDGTTVRLDPTLNAGTVAVQYLFSKWYDYPEWLQRLDPNAGFTALYNSMFGDPWARALAIEPLFPPGLNQPTLILPFEKGRMWSFTGGPHPAWEQESALGALDFAPASSETGCVESDAWATAAAPGKVVRSSAGMVILDLDGDGFEETGWVLLYMHIATKDRVPMGTWLNTGDRIGHPSCEGGIATGTHIHFARKYNGEWVGAGGPLPFVLSGYMAHAGSQQLQGTLTKGDRIVIANQFSMRESQILRAAGE